jgi:photosystem II stability/assembly factor-like uncharacterized protein
MPAMRACLLMFLATFGILPTPIGANADKNQWVVLTSGIDTNLRGISADFTRPLSESGDHSVVIWVCGSNGVILRSIDDGKTWSHLHVEGGDKLDFRGIRSFGASIAYVMSVGESGKSRIYKTTDDGQTWRFQYADQRREFFLDALVCESEARCFALSDPVDGKFLLLRTEDGERWQELPRDEMPAALPSEGAFAASNSSLAFCGRDEMFFGTGGPAARVFHSVDAGLSWNVVQTPVLSGNASSGIFSLRCAGETLVAVGGDYRTPTGVLRVAATSADGGKTWKVEEHQPEGFRSAVEAVDGKTWIAVGTSGEDISTDGGMHWKRSASLDLNAVLVLNDRTILAVGPNGTVTRFNIP